MSFILDALKKSEIERQRQSVPGLMEAGIARPRRRLPVWAVALAVLLGVNLMVLSFVLLRNGAPASVVHTAGPAAASRGGDGGAPPSVSTGAFSPLSPTPDYAPEIPVDEAARVVPPRPEAAKTLRRRDPRLTGADSSPQPYATVKPDPALRETRAAPDDEVLPTINELSTTGAQALPELHLDVHVYGTRAADRFVYVNNRKYHEGNTLQEGPTVENIRRDGVVLSYQGMRFLLPRQ